MLEYRYVLPMLEEARVQSHFLDVLGWGLTECPTIPEFRYGPTAKREHLRAFVDQVVGGGPLVLVGASLGGAIAIDFALNFPKLVQGMVLLSPQAFTDKRSSPVMQLNGIAGMGAEVLRSNWLRRLAMKMSYENEEMRSSDDILKIGGLHCQKPGWKEAAVDFIKGEGYCISTRVRQVNCPTLVLWGEQDRVLPKKNAQRFVEEMATCRLQYVENCGHSPHIEKPSLVTDNILQFVRCRHHVSR
ncbi:putative hydrolase YugF [Gracilariopsis chorda]|uniref:Putative hydrolase YugF n=1 Tax=Gracilariopsis chorda TaxID=448386 RepID=A0A2V3IHD0_9FLOR|nr:putative hydrolase YugF [Gracilariopsis chorda]|eukprot:PXF41491.1 putative hydrolase YugF [Gracilariopsis chorda]